MLRRSLRHLVLLAALLAPWWAKADPTSALCSDSRVVEQGLKDRYHETPVLRAASNGGQLLTVYASPDGTYTITMTRGDISCLVDGGEGLVLVDKRGEEH